MAVAAPPEPTSAEPLPAAPVESEAVPFIGPEGEPLPERSPFVPASDYAARLAAPAAMGARAAPGIVSSIQAEYGNAYAVELISRMRGQPGIEAEDAEPALALAEAEPEVAAAALEPVAPTTPAEERAAPEAPPAVIEALGLEVPNVTPALPAPEVESEVEPEPAPAEPAPEAAAVPAPEPPVPEPAGTTPEALSGEEPAGGDAAMAAVEAEAATGAAETEAVEAPPAEAAAEAPAEGEAAAEETAAEGEKAPSAAAEDPAYQAVMARARAVAQSQGHNNPAAQKAAEAQAAAPGPANELQDAAAGEQVGKMAEQDPAPFDKEKFKRALMDRVAAITPRNLEEADDFKDDNKAASIKGDVASQVSESKEGTQAPVKETAEEAPDIGSVEPKPVEPLPPTDPGAPPPDIGAQGAAPKPKSEAEVSLSENSKKIDDLTESNDPPITEEFVEKSNEPEFQSAYEAKEEAQQDAGERPAAYREEEHAIVASAQQQAVDNATTETQAMHQTRDEHFAAIVETQGETQTEDQTRRAGILQDVRAIYEETKAAVNERLDALDGEVESAFDAGAESAREKFENYIDQRMRAYKRQRYSGLLGGGRWLKDKLLGMPDEVNVFYTEGRDLYVGLMEGVVDHVAGIVAAGLNEAMALIADGRRRVQEYVAILPAELQEVGQGAADEIQADFDNLAQDVTDRQDRLVDSLAQRYADNLAAIDARIGEMQAANRGLVDAALDAVAGLINTIIELKNMLLGVLARAADVIGTIISDPIGFLGNLISAVRLGLDNFISNLGTHLQQGLMAWLFGALAEAGIQMPESFDLRGILSLVLQVLGLTYANIRARAVAIVGEPVVAALEQAAEIFRVLITEGPAGLWRYIQDKLSAMKDAVLEGIKSFVMERIIIAGITWMIGLLNPAGAFIKACKAIYDIVMFFVTRGSQIMALVNAILDSISAIASGAIGGAAAAVEGALARAIPVVIGFLASLLGLGGISEKIREVIQRIRAPINAAIDWVINQAVAVVRAAGQLLLGGREGPTEGEDSEESQDVKEKAGRDLRNKLDDVSGAEEIRGILSGTLSKYRPDGLQALEAVVDDVGGIRIIAIASPGDEVASGDVEPEVTLRPRDLGLRYGTVLIATLNGVPLPPDGRFDASREGGHAENAMAASLRASWNSLRTPGQNVLVVRITRSPCPACHSILQSVINELNPPQLRLFEPEPFAMDLRMMSDYRGRPAFDENVDIFKRLAAAGITLSPWAVIDELTQLGIEEISSEQQAIIERRVGQVRAVLEAANVRVT